MSKQYSIAKFKVSDFPTFLQFLWLTYLFATWTIKFASWTINGDYQVRQLFILFKKYLTAKFKVSDFPSFLKFYSLILFYLQHGQSNCPAGQLFLGFQLLNFLFCLNNILLQNSKSQILQIAFNFMSWLVYTQLGQ